MQCAPVPETNRTNAVACAECVRESVQKPHGISSPGGCGWTRQSHSKHTYPRSCRGRSPPTPSSGFQAVILPGSARLALHPSAHVANKRCQHPQANKSPRLICATRSLPRRMRKAVDQHRTRLASPAGPSCCGILPPEVCMSERTVFLISGSRIPRGLVRDILSEIASRASELSFSFVAPRFGRALRPALL